MIADEFYESLEDETMNPFNFLTEKEYIFDHLTFKKFTSHPYVWEAYWSMLKYNPWLTKFTMYGIIFKLEGHDDN